MVEHLGAVAAGIQRLVSLHFPQSVACIKTLKKFQLPKVAMKPNVLLLMLFSHYLQDCFDDSIAQKYYFDARQVICYSVEYELL